MIPENWFGMISGVLVVLVVIAIVVEVLASRFAWIMRLLGHVRYWGETYIAGPIVMALLILSAWLVVWLTGRESTEDIGSIVGTLINAVRIVIVCMMTGLTQHFLFGYRSNGCPQPKLSDDIHDSCVTCFLLLLFSVLLFGLIR